MCMKHGTVLIKIFIILFRICYTCIHVKNLSLIHIFGAFIAVFLVAVYFFGARGLYRLFFTEEHIIAIGINIMHVIIFVVIFQICQVIYMGCLRGAGDTLYTAIASMISVTFIRTIVSYLCGYALGGGIIGIWLGVLADQMSRFIFATVRFKQGKWKMCIRDRQCAFRT